MIQSRIEIVIFLNEFILSLIYDTNVFKYLVSLRRKEGPQIHVSLNYLTSQNRLDVSVIDIKNLTGDRLIYLKVCLKCLKKRLI